MDLRRFNQLLLPQEALYYEAVQREIWQL